jgi:phosphate:Na+ symporter
VSEVLSEPEYLNKMAAESPETGLVLVEREQLNLMQRLPHYLNYVRTGAEAAFKTHPSAYHEAFVKVSEAISDVLSGISGQSLNEADSAGLIRVTKLQELMVNLEGIVYKMATRLEEHDDTGAAAELGQRILESMDFMVLAGLDAIKSREANDIATLAMLTDDRSQMMDKVRRNYFQSENELTQAGRNFILDITILFENTAITLERCAGLLRA